LLRSRIFECMTRCELKYNIALFLMLPVAQSLCAQDLIITISQDSVHCRVEKTTDTFIYYRTRKTKRSSMEIIARKEVIELIYNFEQDDIPDAKIREYARFQIYGGFTGSRLLSEIPRNLPNEFSEYLNGLKWGIGYSGGVNFMISKSAGVGMLFSQTEFNNSVDVMQVGTGITGILSDDIRLSYLGASFVYSGSVSNSETFFQLNVGLGYLWYLNEARTIYPYSVESTSIGGHLQGSVNFSLGSDIYIPLQLGIKGFSVPTLTASFNEGVPDEYREAIRFELMNNEPAMLMRLELSVGLLISF